MLRAQRDIIKKKKTNPIAMTKTRISLESSTLYFAQTNNNYYVTVQSRAPHIGTRLSTFAIGIRRDLYGIRRVHDI